MVWQRCQQKAGRVFSSQCPPHAMSLLQSEMQPGVSQSSVPMPLCTLPHALGKAVHTLHIFSEFTGWRIVDTSMFFLCSWLFSSPVVSRYRTPSTVGMCKPCK